MNETENHPLPNEAYKAWQKHDDANGEYGGPYEETDGFPVERARAHGEWLEQRNKIEELLGLLREAEGYLPCGKDENALDLAKRVDEILKEL